MESGLHLGNPVLSELKQFVKDQAYLSPDLVLIGVGALAHLALCAVAHKPWTSAWGLLAPLLLGTAIEGYEIWQHYRPIGLQAPGNDPLLVILARHGIDVLKMLALPAVMVAAGRLLRR